MPRTATRQLADIRLGRSLDEFVAEFRAANGTRGGGWRAVSDALFLETGLRISHETLRVWFTKPSGPSAAAPHDVEAVPA